MNGKFVQFDLLTQRFIVNRWNTPVGREVRDDVIERIHAGERIIDVLEASVLKHPDNIDPHEFPYYPPEAMKANDFWVLSSDDLRGIHFYDEDFANAVALARKNLSFSLFNRCVLANVDFSLSDLESATMVQCDLSNAVFAKCHAENIKIISSKLTNTCFLESNLNHANFEGSDLRGVYFEDTKIENIEVDYLTKFDEKLAVDWHHRILPLKHLPDLYRNIRIGYENADLYNIADNYLLRERVANRKYILWPRLTQKFSVYRFLHWFMDLVWSLLAGYGTRPLRTVFFGMGVSVVYTLIYYFAGTPIETSGDTGSLLSALYFSFTTFATLGYGDITYNETRDLMRLISTSEAWIGAVFIALFVVILARKIIRR